MKKTSFFTLILALSILSCNKQKTVDYVYLNKEQLKPLGVELSENGVFYKNYNPKWNDDGEKYAYLGFYSSNDVYLNSFHYNENDTLKAESVDDSLFISKETTRNDFYPILVGNTKGQYSLDNEEKNIKLLPIAICMEETGLSERKDTLVIWIKMTESLKQMLPADIKVEDYLRVPDDKTKN